MSFIRSLRLKSKIKKKCTYKYLTNNFVWRIMLLKWLLCCQISSANGQLSTNFWLTYCKHWQMLLHCVRSCSPLLPQQTDLPTPCWAFQCPTNNEMVWFMLSILLHNKFKNIKWNIETVSTYPFKMMPHEVVYSSLCESFLIKLSCFNLQSKMHIKCYYSA